MTTRVRSPGKIVRIVAPDKKGDEYDDDDDFESDDETNHSKKVVKSSTVSFTRVQHTPSPRKQTPSPSSNEAIPNSILALSPPKAAPTPTPTPSTSTSASTASYAKRDDLDKKLKFNELCKIFEHILKSSEHNKKLETLQKFWRSYKGGDFFPIMRLTLPQLDNLRVTYLLKELKIAKYYTEILHLPNSSKDYNSLMKWKNPSNTKNAEGNTFSDTVFYVLGQRGWSTDTDKGQLSVYDVNCCLDELAKAAQGAPKKAVLLKLLKSTSAFEQKWLIRIILKDMKMGVKHTKILDAFHPQANDLFNAQSDLKHVCDTLGVPSAFHTNNGTTIGTQNIKLFAPVKPMLASTVFPSKLGTILESGNCVIEPKYDGERIMIHVKNNTYMYFTRNSKDYTELYGPKFNHIIKKCVKAESCILDGEFLVWNKELNAFKEFGHNRTHALSEEGSAPNEQFCYMVFDVLYYNGREITSLILSERKAVLNKIIAPSAREMELVSFSPVKTEQEVFQALETAILNRDEGIMLKDMKSIYTPDERKTKWMKLKPDGVDGIGETFDLLIVGGFYGTKYGTKSISHFLMAVVDTSTGATQPDRFLTVCKVGSGYTSTELKELQAALQDHWKPYDPNTKLPHLAGWIPASSERPDVYIDPRKSKILEVKAYSINETSKFKTGCTFRFPRVVRIRNDKEWYDCLDYKTLLELYTNYKLGIKTHQKKNRNISDMTSSDLSSKKRTRKAEAATTKKPRTAVVIESLRDTDTTSVEQVSSLFSGMEFAILNTDDSPSRAELERKIVEYGGTKVANPGDKTTHLIAANAQSARVQNWSKSSRDPDIIHYSWLLECINTRTLVPLHPKYMIHTSAKTQASFSKQIDVYGDDYYEDIQSVEQLKVSLRKVSELHPGEQLRPLDWKQICEINKECSIKLEGCSPYFMFSNVVAYVDRYSMLGEKSTAIKYSPLELTELWILTYGGRVRDTLTSDVTHIIIDSSDSPSFKDRLAIIKRMSSLKDRVKVLKAEWVTACIARGELVSSEDEERLQISL